MGGRRIITRVTVFLLLGAIVNVAVAWGSYHYAESGPPEPVPNEIARELIQPHVGADFTLSPDRTFGLTASTTGSRDLYCFSAMPHGSVGLRVIDVGWPIFSLHGEVLFRGPVAEYLSCIPFGELGLDRLKFVPARPIWPGFAINTIFYAAILWLLFAAPFALRRRQRIKRGLCPACAYPIGDSEVCTECGKPVRVRSVEPASR